MSQGLIIAGLAYASLVPFDPTSFATGQGVALVPVVAALVVAAGTWRWFHGSRWLMQLANLILLLIGLLGTYLTTGLGGVQGSFDTGTVPFGGFVVMEVAATFAGLVAATQRFSGPPAAPTEGAPESAVEVPDVPGLPTT